MHRCLSVLRTAICVVSFVPLLYSQANQSTAAGPCRAYFDIAPISLHTMMLFDPPVAIADPNDLQKLTFEKVRDWDFPREVSHWRKRLGEAEYAQRHEQFSQAWFAPVSVRDKSQKKQREVLKKFGIWLSRIRPERMDFFPGELSGLKLWFVTKGQKHVPSFCIDTGMATWVLEVGRVNYHKPTYIAGIPGKSATGPKLTPAAFQNPDFSRPQDCSTGCMIQPAPWEDPPSYLVTDSMKGIPPRTSLDYQCAYLYRKDTPGAKVRETPEFFYCTQTDPSFQKAVTRILQRSSKDLQP